MAADELDTDYAAAGFGGNLQPGRRLALLVVDMVMAYLDPESPLYAHGEDALACTLELAGLARTANIPVILTNIEYSQDGHEGGMFYRKVPGLRNFRKGSALGAFPAGLHQPGDRVLGKFYPSAFFGTALAPALVAQGIDTLLICGYSTSGCVRATALDALCHGFVPLVVQEGCADRDSRPHEANLFDIQAKIGEVISAQQAKDVLAGAGRQA